MTVKRYRTGMELVQLLAVLGLISGAIFGGMLAWAGKESWWAVPVVALVGMTVITLIGAPIMWQRVELDAAAGHMRYHNIGSLHRWRHVALVDVLEVRLDSFADKRKAMVSGLHLCMRNGCSPARHRLMDNAIGSYKGPSPFFRQIAAAVLRAQPRSLVDPLLRAAD
ncbi:MAG: hypothetical protein ACN6PQ_03875 [Stenotrophomonas indicatrix]|uniref:hypothetical protein n=1 Tax=Stenotrophomonas indicatrix TaxID=2045451 RepID=UPI000F9940C8